MIKQSAILLLSGDCFPLKKPGVELQPASATPDDLQCKEKIQ
jgi:hypothetical protein